MKSAIRSSSEEKSIAISKAYRSRCTDKKKVEVAIQKRILKRDKKQDVVTNAIHVIVKNLKNKKNPEALLTYEIPMGDDHPKTSFNREMRDAIKFLHEERMKLGALIEHLKVDHIVNFFKKMQEYLSSVRSIDLYDMDSLGKGRLRCCKITGKKVRSNAMKNVVVKLVDKNGVLRVQKLQMHNTWALRLHHWVRVGSMFSWLLQINNSGDRAPRAEEVVIMALKNSFQFLTTDLIGSKGTLDPSWFKY